MSFFTNPAQQITLDDALFSLTARERKALENSWAKIFADELFPKIEEEPFRVLYCENNGRPNTPINIMVGASIIKELLDYSDDDIVEGLMLDVRLHTPFTPQVLRNSPFLTRVFRIFVKSAKNMSRKLAMI